MGHTLAELEGIAAGGPFDTTEAIRAIAIFLAGPADDEDLEALYQVVEGDDLVVDATAPATLEDLLGEKLADLLADNDILTLEDVRTTSDASLLALKGLGDAALATIRRVTGAI